MNKKTTETEIAISGANKVKMKRRFLFEFVFSLMFAAVFFVLDNKPMYILGMSLAFAVTPGREILWYVNKSNK